MADFFQGSLFSKTFLDSSAPTADELLLVYSPGWQNQGRWTLRGQCWTHSGSESRNAAAVCSLSQILEESAPPKYWLSPKAARGILRRAEKRGRELPEQLRLALTLVARAAETPKRKVT